jgi:hypothetical protein
VKKFSAAIATAALLGGLGVASVATAVFAGASEIPPTTFVCPDWTLHSTVPFLQDDPPKTITFEAAPSNSGVQNSSTVVLTKPVDNQNGSVGGTEFIASDLNIDLPVNSNIIVSFSLSGGATTDAGAIRLFYYTTTHPDTLNTAPTKFTAATGGPTGNILITGVTGHIGAIGLVYDPSNDPGFKSSGPLGAVTFTSLRIVNVTGVTALSFNDSKCPMPTPSPTTPAPSPSATGTSSGGSGVPSGGVQTGGGIVHDSATGYAIPITVIIAILIGVAIGLHRRVKRSDS